jgi:Domain of unknown function (DUF4968)
LFTLQIICISSVAFAAEKLTNYESYNRDGRSITFTTSTGQRLRITPYGNYIIRVQVVRRDEMFFPDDHYEMVETHNWPGVLRIVERESSFQITTGGIAMELTKSPLRIAFYQLGQPNPVLKKKTARYGTDPESQRDSHLTMTNISQGSGTITSADRIASISKG